jgi:dipeptide/tripeptide permease
MNKKNNSTKFPKTFWVAVIMEFFERGSYYGMMSVLSVFLVLSGADGGLGFSKEQAGSILGTIPPLLYFLPIIAGAIADRYGYRKILYFAFSCMVIGYGLTGIFSGSGFDGMESRYFVVFASLLIMAIGAGFFKPVIAGTIARSTNESNSGLGFGIFYWSINLGAFLFPLILIPILKSYSYSYIFFLSAGIGVILLLINTIFYREPKLEGESCQEKKGGKPIGQVFAEMLLVVKDWRFLLMVMLYSVFWILYFQMYGTVLWYVDEHMDMTPINNAVNSFLGLFVENPSWFFDVEHVTVVNAGVIILLQLFVSKIVQKAPALPTMIVGIGFGTLGMAILALSNSPWLFIVGIMTFTLGEMTAHPKYNSYIGMIAPADKKALYMGYSFLYGVIGSSIGGFVGAALYVKYVEEMANPSAFYLIFAALGVFSMIALILYNRFIAPKK